MPEPLKDQDSSRSGTENASAGASAETSPGVDREALPGQASPERKVFTFADMHLRVGDRLQVECPAHMGVDRVFVRLVGYVENASLIVTAPVHSRKRLTLADNDLLVVRAFSRHSAYAFRSSVLRTCKLPFEYAHLSFPGVVHGSVVRKSTRVRTQLAARLAQGTEGEPHIASIENISSTGALIACGHMAGAKGDVCRLSVDARLHDVDMQLQVDAEIVSVIPEDEIAAQAGEARYRYGLEFRNLGPNDRMVIKGLVYQQIIENPHSVV